MRVPGWLLQHTVTVEPYKGDSAYGPQYGPAVQVRCFLDDQTRTVRRPDGQEVVSSATFYAQLDTTVCPAESRVTLPSGRQTTVIAALRRDGGGLPVPSHLEVQLL
ncbi:hypothetical protein [Streptomyces sp. NPDC047315]|uniref:hypothetical protein n=1 Tax=Streptomyces sp. NPDC047315 TaxID=3155142 RepID=UPI0033E83F43